jgi:hypothetical protein
MIVQVTLTINEAKWIIAKGIAALPAVKKALEKGKIFLKGGTTVSAVCQELGGEPLRISGRITPSGARSAQYVGDGFHSALIHNGRFFGVDDCLFETIEKMGSEDVVIIGANAFDAHGTAAMMYGSPLGGAPGQIVSGLMAEVRDVIVPVGWEKFIPGSLNEIISRTGRKNVDRSMGMAVGLTPIVGRIVTETDAVQLLADVQCTIVGRGGIDGAEGATTFIVEGSRSAVEKAFDHVLSVKGKGISGCPSSFEACDGASEKCKKHRGCIYKKTSRRSKKR